MSTFCPDLWIDSERYTQWVVFTTATTTTGIHATDQLLVATTPYYAHLYPLLLRARGALQDLDRTPHVWRFISASTRRRSNSVRWNASSFAPDARVSSHILR